MAHEMDLQVTALLCPLCGRRLSAEGEWVIYPCTECHILWEPRNGSLLRQEIHLLTGEGNVHVPFWLFPFRITTQDTVATTLAEYRELTANVNFLAPELRDTSPLLFVPAVSGMPPHLMLRAGRLLTVRSPTLAEMAGFPDGLMNIGMRECDAAIMATGIVLATLGEERRRNLSFLRSLTVTVGSGRLYAIPFIKQGQRLLHSEWSVEI